MDKNKNKGLMLNTHGGKKLKYKTICIIMLQVNIFGDVSYQVDIIIYRIRVMYIFMSFI